MTTPISNTIYASRDAIRDQVIEFLQQYMELNEVDLTQSSFLSYIIDIITTLSSNLMFYQSNIYKEFFLTQAQLPESVHNLSSFIGYNPKEAFYSVANVLMIVNLPFNDPDTEFNIPKGFIFKTSDDISFVTYYNLTVNVSNNTSVVISAEQDEKIFDVPVSIDTTSEQSNFQFILPTRQYKTTIQEFTIDEDLQPYQFTDINIPIDGKVANITIYVREPNASTEDTGRLYERFNSLYLMNSTDYGYVLRVSPEGRKIYFGNGIIGEAPLPGSTVIAHIDVTEGQSGNVIAGSITNGGRIYSQQQGATEIVEYHVINPSPAYNGKDEENLQEIRDNSIKSLVSLNRLVSEQDYKNFDVVIPDAPIKSNSIPVLKRSDLKVNDIQLYTILEFGDEIVPSRNVFTDRYYNSGAWHDISSSTTYIPRGVIIEIDGIDYITLFEMTIDQQNDVAYYHYIMRHLEMTPTLIESWGHDDQDLFHFNINDLNIHADDNTSTALFELTYFSNEVDLANLECTMTVLSSNDKYIMTNNAGTGGGTFSYLFSDYLDIPLGSQTYYFTISNPTALIYQPLISEYSVDFTFRKDLKSFMMSNSFEDGTSTIIYDIPVILNSYYESIDQVIFEKQVLQAFLSSSEFKNYRMLTDFINIKLCNTTGLSKNMLKNKPTKIAVNDIGITIIPPSPNLADRYIVSGNEGGDWNNNRDNIAICVDATANIWTFIEPVGGDIVYVNNKASNYIYSEYGWRKPIYDIPLKITIEIFKVNDSSIQETTLISNIKSTLLNYYKPIFGHKIEIRRSKIIDLVHNINGVSYCRLIEPESGIFFNFNIDEFQQQELLEYTPEWIYFTEDDITIKLFTVGV